MKLKKPLSLLLALALLFTVFSVPVFAEGNNVAKIGEVEYASVAAAIEAVPDDGIETTITMIADETVSNVGDNWLSIAANKNIILDLNGKTISGKSDQQSACFIKNYGELEIVDSGANGKITFSAVADGSYSKENITIYNNGGTLTLTSGKIENTTDGGATYAVNNSSNAWGNGNDKDSIFNMNGGIISAPQGDAALRVYQNCSKWANPYSHNTVNITGGTILDKGIFLDSYIHQPDANTTGVQIVTSVNISGGEIHGLIDLKLRHPFNTSLNITGGTFVDSMLWVRKKQSEWNANVAEPTDPMVHIAGGNFSFVSGMAFGLAYECDATSWTSYTTPYDIFGGKFNLEPPAAFVASGYEAVANTDGDSATYGYKIGTAAVYVAQIGDVKYESLADAIAAVPTNDVETTITMIADEELTSGVTVAAGKVIVLELNGKTISGNSNATATYAVITNRGTLTIQDSTDVNANGQGNGKITALVTTPDQGEIPGYASNVITNNGVLTIDSGLIENTTVKGYAAYTVDNQTNGISYTPVFTMNGGRLYNKYTDAVRLFLNSDSNLNKVVINGGILDSDKASGRVIVVHNPNAKVNKGELDITGGTINGKVNGWSAANAGGVEDRFSDAQYAEISINISGGKIRELSFTEMANETLRAEALQVTGGKYAVDPSAYVAEGYKAISNTDADAEDYPYVVVPYVAQIGDKKYETLVAAVAAANADTTGDPITIELLKDLDFSEEVYAGYTWAGSTYNPLTITRSNVTIDLGGHTISNMGNVAIVFGHMLAANGRFANGTIQNGTLLAGKTDNVTNSYVLGIAGMDGMTIKNVTTNGGINVYTGSKDVVIDSCNVNGTKYYTVCSQSGSDVTIKGTTYTKNTDGTVANKAMFWVAKAGDDEDMITTDNPDGAYEASSITIEGGDFTVDFAHGGSFWLTGYLKPVVKGGTFNFDPTAYVADGYEAVNNGGETWTVGKVKAGEMTKTATTATFDATYTVTKQVINENNNEVIDTGTSREVNVKVVTENTVSQDTTEQIFANLEMAEVLDTVVASVADAADTVNVEIQIARDNPEEIVNNTITYEVHPEAVVFVNNVATETVPISNDALATDASFTIKLPVPNDIKAASNGTIKVTHISEGYPDETRVYEVLEDGNGYYVLITVSHFSQFELQANNQLFAGHSITLNGYINLNFYLNVSESQVTSGAGTVVNFTWGDNSQASYTVQPADYEENRGYRATVAVPAAEMTYQITATVTIGGVEQDETNQYSVYQYALALLNRPDTGDKLKTLLKTMLEFGARAQLAFDINTDSLANLANYEIDYTMPTTNRDVLVEAINAAISAANNGAQANNMNTVAGQIGGAEYYSSSLTYLSGCTLRLYFCGYGLTGFNGDKYGYYYFVEAANIPAAELDKLQEFTVGGTTFKYSALDFVRAIIENYDSNDSFYKLAEATYWYNKAANDYFQPQP